MYQETPLSEHRTHLFFYLGWTVEAHGKFVVSAKGPQKTSLGREKVWTPLQNLHLVRVMDKVASRQLCPLIVLHLSSLRYRC